MAPPSLQSPFTVLAKGKKDKPKLLTQPLRGRDGLALFTRATDTHTHTKSPSNAPEPVCVSIFMLAVPSTQPNGAVEEENGCSSACCSRVDRRCLREHSGEIIVRHKRWEMVASAPFFVATPKTHSPRTSVVASPHFSNCYSHFRD